MILHHSSGKTRLLKRIFSMCIAFFMVCTFSNPAFATDQAITETAAPPEITYNFYSDGELYSSQTVKDGETLTEPTVPTVVGKIFGGWFTTEDETAQKFEAFGNVSVTEKAAVDLYAKWTEQPTNVADEPDSTADAVSSADEVMPASINEDTGTNYSEVKADHIESGTIDQFQSWEIDQEPSVNLLAENGDIPKDDENFIVVEKKFIGIVKGQIPQNFSITVKSENNSYVLKKDTFSFEEIEEEGGTIIWRWKITGVGPGTYTVTEENEVVDNYDVTMQGQGLNEEGKVTVEKAKITTFSAELETSCSHTNWPVRMDGDDNFLFAATLTSSNGTAVISRYPLSASQRLAVQEYILLKADNGAWKVPFHFYSVEEQILNGKGFELNGATITYDSTNSEVNIGQKNDWKQVMTLKYSVSEANNPEIGITNTYTSSLQDITIKKIVTGPLGDINKEFQFAYAYTGADGTFKSDMFKLENGKTATITDVPIGTEIELKETNASGYATTASYGEQAVSVSGVKEDAVKVMKIKITKDENLIVVTNHKDVIPDTGIRLESLPYILILAIVIAGMAVMIVRKCKRRNF